MTLAVQNRSAHEKVCPSASRNCWTGPALNPSHRGARAVTNRLKHNKAKNITNLQIM